MSTETREAAADPVSQFKLDVLEGLRADRKRISCKHFYDERGSALFDQICELDEYYLTRTETAIMREHAEEMGRQIGDGVMLVEYGSGSSTKTRVLLDHLSNPAAYVPVDISREHLLSTSETLSREYPELEVLPVVADFTQRFALPKSQRTPTHAAVYFPGSTIGNFQTELAVRLLRQIADLCGSGGGLLIGIDLVKDTQTLERAYDDSQGVTAEFNLNLLHRLENELDAELDLDGFAHDAFFDDSENRVEISIRSLREQTITIDGEVFPLAENELIHTEFSHKYTVDGFAGLAAEAGLTLRRSWSDQRGYFAVLHFVRLDGAEIDAGR